MRITAITEQYPSDFKPYYDTQFADFLEKGHELTVLADGRYAETVSDKVRDWQLGNRTRHYPASPKTALRALRPDVLGRLPRILPTVGPHRALRAARIAILELSRPDVVLIHGLAPGRLFTGFRDALPDLRVGCYYHGGEPPTAPGVPDRAAKEVFEEVDVVFTNTEFAAHHAVGRGCPPDRIHVLPVGLDLQAYHESGPAPLNRRPLRLLSAGRMSREKGYIYALKALALLEREGLRDFTYALTGKGRYREELEAFLETSAIRDRVRFMGVLPMSRLIEEMDRADLLLLPSLHLGNWAENQAVAVQEAVLMGALPITTSTGGLPESTPEAALRFQVPPEDPRALADAIREAASLDHSERRAVVERCRQFVRDRYDIRTLNQRMLSLLAG